ncbi:WbqC family protein [Methylophilaceae bacterium]|nr:WbqC family protein [Methylophilaceae bacterium]
MQPYFFPYLGYWHLMDAVDVFILFDDVNYIKKGFINRNSILINNEPKLISLSLRGASQNKKIMELTLADSENHILKTIELAYKKSLNFDVIFPVLQSIFINGNKSLVDFLELSINKINSILGIETKVLRSSQFNLDYNGRDKIIPICKELSACTYINPIGGLLLYNGITFKENGLKLKFINSKFIEYPQGPGKFFGGLSVIDLLMSVPMSNWVNHTKAYEEVEGE